MPDDFDRHVAAVAATLARFRDTAANWIIDAACRDPAQWIVDDIYAAGGAILTREQMIAVALLHDAVACPTSEVYGALATLAHIIPPLPSGDAPTTEGDL